MYIHKINNVHYLLIPQSGTISRLSARRGLRLAVHPLFLVFTALPAVIVPRPRVRAVLLFSLLHLLLRLPTKVSICTTL